MKNDGDSESNEGIPMDSHDSRFGPEEIRSRPVLWILFFTSLLFIAAGTWIALDGDDFHDRLMGGVSVLFFAACAVSFGYMIKTKRS
jgi:hypothetical protein